MAGCQCEVPHPGLKKTEFCRVCGRMIDRDYVSSEKTMAQFLSYLRTLPEVPDAFIQVVEGRSQQGRRPNERLDYLSGNVRTKGLALAADLAIQAHYYLLQCAKNGVEPDLGAAMEAATYASKAWEAMKRL